MTVVVEMMTVVVVEMVKVMTVPVMVMTVVAVMTVVVVVVMIVVVEMVKVMTVPVMVMTVVSVMTVVVPVITVVVVMTVVVEMMTVVVVEMMTVVVVEMVKMSGEMDIGLGLSSSLDREPSASWKPTSACSDGESVVCSGKEQVANEVVDAEAKWENMSGEMDIGLGLSSSLDREPSGLVEGTSSLDSFLIVLLGDGLGVDLRLSLLSVLCFSFACFSLASGAAALADMAFWQQGFESFRNPPEVGGSNMSKGDGISTDSDRYSVNSERPSISGSMRAELSFMLMKSCRLCLSKFEFCQSPCSGQDRPSNLSFHHLSFTTL
ncbi:hypothetical protein CRUP_037713 [Coryphaenoides rupestris]|nr:hypothetical protein CRUP_037713 [Coryphaenoides rupestris]